VENACQYFKVPNNYKQLALKVCQFHLHCHKAFELKPSTLLKMFNQVDLWRKPDEFEDFLLACEADFKGRLHFEDKPYPQADYLRACAQLVLAVNAKTYVSQGLKGKAIKEAMDNERINIISEFKEKYLCE
jgi:tRNA nucleotidyltransferase (CCA-adding enzyme)